MVTGMLGVIALAFAGMRPHDVTLTVDLASAGQPLPHLWSRCLGSGHAALTLRADWRDTVRNARKELGLEMVRFHGILDDDMSVSLSRGVHSWLNVDSTVDFLVSEGMRSVIELSFMPDWLANKVFGCTHAYT